MTIYLKLVCAVLFYLTLAGYCVYLFQKYEGQKRWLSAIALLIAVFGYAYDARKYALEIFAQWQLDFG